MPETYRIRLGGHLDGGWEVWFEGFSFSHQPDGTTLLQGQVADQPALHGLLVRINRLGLPLLQVEQIEKEYKMDEMHVVIGGSGGLGRAVAARLARKGKRVRAVNRSGLIELLPEGIEAFGADALQRQEVVGACAGATVVYHCAHPRTAYSRFPAMTENILNGAEVAGARLVMAASAYPYGPVDRPMTENLPHQPAAPSGEYHALGAELVMEAHAAGRLRATIGRASNYFGPHAPRMWPGIDFRTAVLGDKMQIIGKTSPPHTYTYVYDFAEGLITLGQRDEALGQIWHIPSAPTVSTGEFLDMLYEEAGTRPNVQIGSKAILTVLSWFNSQIKPALEVFYQFDRPFVIDHSKYEKAFGAEPTSHREAIAETVRWVMKERA